MSLGCTKQVAFKSRDCKKGPIMYTSVYIGSQSQTLGNLKSILGKVPVNIVSIQREFFLNNNVSFRFASNVTPCISYIWKWQWSGLSCKEITYFFCHKYNVHKWKFEFGTQFRKRVVPLSVGFQGGQCKDSCMVFKSLMWSSFNWALEMISVKMMSTKVAWQQKFWLKVL